MHDFEGRCSVLAQRVSGGSQRETAEMGKMGEKREEDDSACKANANRKLKGGRR